MAAVVRIGKTVYIRTNNCKTPVKTVNNKDFSAYETWYMLDCGLKSWESFCFQDTYLWVDKLLLRNSIFRRNNDQTWKRLPPNSAYEVDVKLALAFIRHGAMSANLLPTQENR